MWFVLYRLGLNKFLLSILFKLPDKVCVIRRNRSEKIKQVDKICYCVLLCAVLILKKLHCFFVVIDEHESVTIFSLKVNHFFCDVEKVQISRLSRDGQLNMSTVSAQVPVIMLFFITCSFTEFEEKSSGSKIFGFFSIKAGPNLRISSCFSSLNSSLQRATALQKQFPRLL